MSRLRTLLLVSVMLLPATWLAYYVGHHVGSTMIGFVVVGVAGIFMVSVISPLLTPQRARACRTR